MNHIPFNNYSRANELLYILNATKREDLDSISKIGIQKVLYLANLLAPVKNVILSTLRFLSYTRGPYAPDVQNTLDQLTANGFVYITTFREFKAKSSVATYSISTAGEAVVNKLTVNPKEDEKKWWFESILKLSAIYSDQPAFLEGGSYSGFDKIVNLVYEDDTFLNVKDNLQFASVINLKREDAPTFTLINFIKNYVSENKLLDNGKNERWNAEIVLIGFFEFLYSKYLDNLSNE